MSSYQLTKETPPGSGKFANQGAPVEAADPTGDPELDAEPDNIVEVVAEAQDTQGGCWAAYKIGA